MKQLNVFEESIRSLVCAECIYPSGAGMCGSGQWEECPLNKYLPLAIDAVSTGKSKSILEYFRSLHVQGRRTNGTGDRVLTTAEAAWFERFLPLIAAAVEEVAMRKKSVQNKQGLK